MVGGKIAKRDTKFGEAVPASLRLAVTQRFLVSGDSFTSLQNIKAGNKKIENNTAHVSLFQMI